MKDGSEHRCGAGTSGFENQENMIEKYILTIPESDGKNGYYVSFPEITIKHIKIRAAVIMFRVKPGHIKIMFLQRLP